MILVTGATGKVGRHLVTRLITEGAPVWALTRDPAAANLPAIGRDLRTEELTPEAFRQAASAHMPTAAVDDRARRKLPPTATGLGSR